MIADTFPWVSTWTAELRRRDPQRFEHTPEDLRSFERMRRRRREQGSPVRLKPRTS